ncbi:protease 3 precursor [Variibacter gotjawalensis]|uniref:Protease 3 n=1 Tax=Variibacter gotjawalensis TaxID=1333996 RepID=A0A0S3PS44_9BRAD|nr:pitrilysin family protein [Variibacter gotjawalensis]NIK49073.1 putative Zn-dependent peptidase [Variibacter gotjawalensis]RZS50929.1 putative Zn-dependent peptidase [Variibacter gotjawalensis]BAT58763.1 protease 3 precursor [Variibacter gotjawalensis]
MSVEITRLPSGLTVVTDDMPHLQTASLGVWTGAGSRDEHDDEHGIAHVLEHMAFKGTRRRSALDIAEVIEAVGGDLNAATSNETTAYYARMLKDDVPLALDVLSDILSEPSFDANELKREKQVIVQEIGAAEDAPDDLVFEYLHGTAYPDQPVGRTILGTPESVRSVTPKKLRNYLSRNYKAPDMVIGAAGAVDHKRIVDDVAERFASFTGPEGPAPVPAKFVGGTRLEARDLEQVHVTFALEGLPQKDPMLHSLHVFTNALGGGMSSRLFQQVREQRGLCYSIYSFHWPYSDTGTFGVYAGTDAGDTAELMRVCIAQLAEATETLTQEEVNRAKAQMKAGLLMALESSSSRAEQLARQVMIYDRVLTTEEIVAKVDAVTVESARAAGRKLLSRNGIAVAALGPGRGLENAATIAHSLIQRAA